ncbi:MAG: hypothetical protein H7330_04865 [Hymenobacteraceae bacterium]|nr:hypothetical protein [Hymenobacteraceae bacterium]
MRLPSILLLLLLIGAAPACQTSRKIPCPTDAAKGGLFGFLKKKKTNATAAMQESEGQGSVEDSPTAAQADAGRSIGGGGFKEDKHGLIKKKKFKHLRNQDRTGQRSFLGLKF